MPEGIIAKMLGDLRSRGQSRVCQIREEIGYEAVKERKLEEEKRNAPMDHYGNEGVVLETLEDKKQLAAKLLREIREERPKKDKKDELIY